MKPTLFLLLLVFPFFIHAQKNQKKASKYSPGAIISLNDDTLAVKIRFENIIRLQDEVRFLDSSGKKKSFKPNMIKGFFIDTENSILVFESRQDVRISAFPSKNGYFVLRISNDIFPLYYFMTSKILNTGVESKTVQIPNYLIQVGVKWSHFNSDSFEDCTKIFAEHSALVEDIKNDKYVFDDFPKIVEEYCNYIKSQTN